LTVRRRHLINIYDLILTFASVFMRNYNRDILIVKISSIHAETRTGKISVYRRFRGCMFEVKFILSIFIIDLIFIKNHLNAALKQAYF
jgi:hypothetical protein